MKKHQKRIKKGKKINTKLTQKQNLLWVGAILALVLLCFSFVFNTTNNVATAATGINRQINFQGKLVNADGTNVTDGSYSILFSIYSVSSGGVAIWSETQNATLTNGIFQVNLGSVTALPGSVDFNTDNIYLGIKVGADPEMTPRVQFTSVPQAFNAEKLGGLDKTGFIQNGTSLQTNTNFNIQSASAASIGGVIRGAISQSADLLQLQNSSGNRLSGFDSAGKLQFADGIGGAYDTVLYRSAASTLKTDDSFTVGTGSSATNLIVTGSVATPLQIARNTASNVNIQYTNATTSLYAGMNPSSLFAIGSGADLSSAPFTVDPTSGNTFVQGNLKIGSTVRSYASQYSTTIAANTPIEVGEFTYTGNSQNLIFTGEIRGQTGASTGVSRFQISTRSNTLPSKSFTFSQDNIKNPVNLQAHLYEDTTTGRVVIAFTSDTALQNVGWSITAQERADYNYFQNQTSYTVLSLTGLTEIPMSTAYVNLYNGKAIFQNNTDSATAFQVQNALGTAQVTVDTTTGNLTAVGDLAANGGDLTSSATTFNLLNSAVTTLNVGGVVGSGGINLAGGSSSTGCTIDGSNGNLTCSGAISTTATTGTQGWWNRSGTTLQPSNAGDAITTTGTISTTGSGTITSAGLLTGSAGLTVGGGAVNLNTSGANATNVGTGTSTGAVAIGNSSNAANTLTIEAGTGATAIQIGNGATAHGVQIATGAAAQTVSIGSTDTTSATTLSAGTGYLNLIASGGSNTGIIAKANTNSTAAFQVQNASNVSLLTVDTSNTDIKVAANVYATGSATANTGTTSGTGTNTTTLTLTGAVAAFADNDVIFIDNAGQDYYTRIVSGGGTATLTVSPAITFENTRTVTEYTVQNIGSATNAPPASNNERFFQGYFLGGVVTGAGSTTLSDGQLQSSTYLNLDTSTTGSISLGTNANAKTVSIGNNTGATAINITAGTGNVNISGTTNITGNTTVTGNATVTGTIDVTGSVAAKRGSDYSTIGTLNDVNFGEVSLVRLTGASAQTITGIAGGRDGKTLTIVNAASQSALLNNDSASSVAANRIITGTGGTVPVPAGASVSLVYDSASTRWRVVGSPQGNGVAPGSIVAMGTATPPSGYLVANGQAVSRSTYAELFAAIGTSYGAGDGSTTFNVPDLRGRTAVGADSGAGRITSNNTMGASGGAQSRTITASNLPVSSPWSVTADTHLGTFAAGGAAASTGLVTDLVGSSNGGGSARGFVLADDRSFWTGFNASTTITVGSNSGGGQALGTLDPYQVVTYMIATTQGAGTTAMTTAYIQGGNSFGADAYLGTNDAYNLLFETAGTERMRITSSGNVGINNNSALYKLSVVNEGGAVGSSQVHINNSTSDSGGYILGYTNGGTSAFLASSGTSFNGTNWIAKGTIANILSEGSNGFDFFSNSGLTVGNSYSPTFRARLDTSGNFGVGIAPSARLEVLAGSTQSIRFGAASSETNIGSNSDSYGINLVGGNPDGTSQGGQIFLGGGSRGDGLINGIQFLQNGTEVGRFNNGGGFKVNNWGVFGGTTDHAGSEPLEVQGSGAGLSLYDRVNGATNRWVIYSNSNTLRFYNATGGDVATINNAGDITARLVATGGAAMCFVGGSNNDNGQHTLTDCTAGPVADYAEKYPMAAGSTYGDIVSLGTTMINTYGHDADFNVDWNNVIGQVAQGVKTTAAYQSNTVGIVSDNYSDFSSTGNNIRPEDNPMPVALNGRVPVNIAADSPAIQPGDYITTSGTTAGKGMKATQGGYVIGKALEAWVPGSGDAQVMIFVEPGYWPGPTLTGFLQNGDDATINNLTVTGSANLATLNVSGASTLASLTVTGDVTITSKLIVTTVEVGDITVGGHVITAGTAPAGQVLGASGVGATYTIDGNDTAGTIAITTGSTSITSGDLAKITFNKAFGKVPKIVLSPQDDPTTNARIFPSAKTLNDYTLKTSQTLLPNTTYTLDYFIVE